MPDIPLKINEEGRPRRMAKVEVHSEVYPDVVHTSYPIHMNAETGRDSTSRWSTGRHRFNTDSYAVTQVHGSAQGSTCTLSAEPPNRVFKLDYRKTFHRLKRQEVGRERGCFRSA